MKVMTENLKYIDIDPSAAGKLAQQLHIKKEEIPFIRKSFLADKQEGNAKERSVVSYISTGVKDRDNEALVPGGVKLENYRKNPVVMWGHDYSNLPVGKNIWIKKDENGLMAKTVFAKSKRGEELFKAYTEDIEGTGTLLKGWSVGFIPVKWEDAETKGEEGKASDVPRRVYTEWELLEYSAVPIPSCPEALTLAVEKNLVPEFLKKDLEPEFKSRIAHLDEMVFELGQCCLDKEGIKWMWNGAWIGEDGIPAKKEISIKEMIEPIIKPETTEKYHRIPVNPGCEVTATITISAAQGIKAIYCGKVKKVHTYLFDVNKWTMAEAKKWVEDHKDTGGYYQEIIDGHMKGLEIMSFEAEEKEGRVLSKRNRALLSAVIKAVKEALPPLEQLLEATEPDEYGEREYAIERDVPHGQFRAEQDVKAEEKRLEKVGKQIDNALIKALPKVLNKVLSEKLELEFNKLKGKVK